MGPLKAAGKHLMGHKKMLMKQFDERNVAGPEDVGGTLFSQTRPAGASFRANSKAPRVTVGGCSVPKVHFLEQPQSRNGTFSLTWQMESEVELLAG